MLASDVCRGLIPHTYTHSGRIPSTPDRKMKGELGFLESMPNKAFFVK
jgi:hypothetical protein